MEENLGEVRRKFLGEKKGNLSSSAYQLNWENTQVDSFLFLALADLAGFDPIFIQFCS